MMNGMRPNGVMKRRGPILASLCFALGAGVAGAAQSQPAETKPPLPPPQTYPQPRLELDLNKIKTALENPQAQNLNEQQLRFYVLVYAKQPRFFDFVGKFDFRNGPVPGAGMTHQEFLSRVTPKDYATSGGIKAIEALQIAITNMAAQTIIKRGLEALRNARDEREVREIRERIDRELAALAGKGH